MIRDRHRHFRTFLWGLVTFLSGALAAVPCFGQSGLLAAGDEHALALHADGTVWTWGTNEYGQLGDGTTVDRDRAAPVLQVDGTVLQRIRQVASGLQFSIALDDAGNVWTWGRDHAGQLGAREVQGQCAFADRVVTADDSWLSNVTAVAAGSDFGLALLADGTVWAWGRNDEGQIGDGTTGDRAYAVQVLRGITEPLVDIVNLASGREHALALQSDGTVWAWGADGEGQLGDDGSISAFAARAIRVHRVGGVPLEGIRQVAAADDFSLAIDREGVLWAWGENRSATFGDGSTLGSVQARAVDLPFDESIAHLAPGKAHVHARTSSGDGWAWGRNGSAQLGGHPRTALSFSKVPTAMLDADGSPLVDLRSLSAGSWSGYAQATDTTVLSWGDASDGQLGRPTSEPGDSEDHRPLPVLTVDGTPLRLDTPERDPVLTVILVGDAEGRVTSEPAGLDWDPGCPGPGCPEASSAFPWGTEILLEAFDVVGSDFVAFSGDRCSGAESSCSFVLEHDVVVRARFTVEPPFEVVNTIPEDGRVGVDPAMSIILDFNRAVLPGPNVDSIVLRPVDGSPVAVQVVVDPDRVGRLSIVPQIALDPATEYELAVPADALVDDEGALLQGPLDLSFTTRPDGPARLTLALPHVTLVEGATRTAWVFFDRPTQETRTIHLYVDPADGAEVPASVTVSAGEIGTSFEILAGAVDASRTVRLEVAERSAGVASRELRVESLDPVPGDTFQFLDCRLVRDEDRDLIFEAEERGLFEIRVWNQSNDKLSGGKICLEGIDFDSEEILEPDHDRCVFLPTLSSGVIFPSQFDLRLSERLASSRYHLRIHGTSSLGDFTDVCALDLVNEGLPDFYLDPGLSYLRNVETEEPIQLDYEISSTTDLFGEIPPAIRWWIENEVGDTVWERHAWADIWRGEIEVDFLAPVVPGNYSFFASVNLPTVLPETDYSNNQESPREFIVRRRNVEPVPEPVEGPLSVEVLQEIVVPISFVDADGDTLAFSLPTAPEGATLEPTGDVRAVVRWTPALDQGPDPDVAFKVHVDDGFGGTAEVSFTLAVSYTVDLAVDVTAPLVAVRGETLVLDLVVSNASPPPVVGAGIVSSVGLGVEGLAWACAPDPGSDCTASGSGAPIDGAIDLEGSSRVTYTLEGTVDAQAPDAFTLEACVGLPPAPPIADPDSANDCRLVELPVVDPGVDLRLQARSTLVSAFPGDRVGVDLVIDNRGPSSAEGVEVDWQWPVSLVNLEVTGCDAASASSSATPCALGNLAPNSSREVRLEWTVDASASPGDHLVEVSVWCVTPETEPGDEALDLTVRVVDPTGLVFRDGFESGDPCSWSTLSADPSLPCTDSSN